MDGANSQKASPVIALAGNPNAGKTTLFNALTGLRHKVANYPGVTVERRSGRWGIGEGSAELIDLPGLYSLDATSMDEEIARDVLRGSAESPVRPDAIVAVVDATNLERNLYLITQIIEYETPVVVALTMMDLFEEQGHVVDLASLAAGLGVPVVPVDSRKGTGIAELGEAVSSVLGNKTGVPNGLAAELAGEGSDVFGRYRFISGLVQSAVKHNDLDAHRFSDRIDSILTHKVWGLLVLFGILLLVFQAIFSWATLPMDLLEAGFGALGEGARSVLPEGMLADLVVDGIIAGVGGILVFLPQIILLFVFISILEDTGYMSRAAFLLDRLMSRIGLHGKAFLPLISSFACAIPGIMATRTIEDRRDRLATIMIAPLMSCSARLPVYVLMIAAFFGGQTVFGFVSLGAVIMLGMYLLGIVAAIVVAFILKRTVLKSPTPPFMMELPPYRMPSFRTVLANVLERAGLFVRRAGTVILAISIILWALAYFPRSDAAAEPGSETAASTQLENSFAGRLGHAIEPVIEPLGYDWKIGVALIASFAAREVLVSTLSILYNVGGDAEETGGLASALRDAKRADGLPVWTPLTSISLMVFFVLAMQCMSTVAIVRRETNSWRWPLFMVVYMTLLAYLGAFVAYQGGRLLGFT